MNSVSATKIFAREVEPGVQGLVYEMKIDAPADLAMVLPLPVRTPAWKGSVKFVNLEGYEKFFADLNLTFPVTRSPASDDTFGAPLGAPPLEVISLGNYQASFVPTISDFSRLDQRFRLPPQSWKKLPQYADYSFAVFKLKKGVQKVHPMALIFESRLQGQLFFPTVHIHDGEVHQKEEFHHALYAQGWLNAEVRKGGWSKSRGAIGDKVDEKKAKGLAWGGGPAWRRMMIGRLPNQDVILSGVPS